MTETVTFVLSKRLVAVVVAGALVLGGGCRSNGEPAADITLDGTPRHPDRAGIVTEVSTTAITVDGKELVLSRKLLAFSTYTLAALPVVSTDGAYVHVGVKDGKAVWVALVARLLPSPEGGKPHGFYTGSVAKVDGRVVTFRDGTVLRAGDGVELPAVGVSVLADLDPERDVLVNFSRA